jgi:putative endonuclease
MITECHGSTFFIAPRCGWYTRSRRPLALTWAQECEHIEDAYVHEHKIKGWRREKKLALINGRYGDLPRLSRSASHKYPRPGVT